MSRYIDADKPTVYFEALAKQAEMEGLYNMAHIHNRCLQIIEDAPPADVVEVRHGYWKDNGRCSCCEAFSASHGADYCPHCGAKMDGERREG